ncbi:MAG: hypothetical protein WDN28_03195 [Chthoniobacter sp.]
MDTGRPGDEEPKPREQQKKEKQRVPAGPDSRALFPKLEVIPLSKLDLDTPALHAVGKK